jgi:RHS repeat-associated protein
MAALHRSFRRVRLTTWLTGGLGVALLVSGGALPAVAAPTAARTASMSASSTEGDDLSRPDRVSALVTARASGERVEDESRRTEFTRVYANPDGTWTSETASAPESVQDESGTWHELDPTLVEHGDRLAPKYGLSDVSISAGGDKVFATMSEEGHDLAWKWPTILPEPVVEGASATYAGVAAGGVGDLVVTATDGGFSYDVVLHEEPTGLVEVAVPVVTDGGVLKETRDGGLAVTTKGGDPVAAAPEPVMFDASTDETGEPTNVAAVDAEVTQPATGAPVLTLLPDEDFLHDADTVYPVTVDPTFDGNSATDDPLYSSDTWIQSPDLASGQGGTEELRVGSKDAGAHKARAYMHFGGTSNPWVGKTIDSADLVLRNFDSGSCTSGAIRASMITEAWGSGISWPGPSVSASYDFDYAPAKGFSTSCPGADATWDVTGMVRQWATGGAANNGIRLSAVDATASNTYRRYRSANYQNYPSLRPHLVVTWHTLPDAAQTPVVWPTTTYTPPGGTAAIYTNWYQPTITSWVSDRDGGHGSLLFRFYPAGSTAWYTSCTGSYAQPDTYTNCQPTDALPDGTYTVRAKAGDHWAWAGGSLEAEAGWSPRRTFTVDTKAPAVPTVTADHAVEGAWGEARPASNTFRVSSSADTASFNYMMDGANPQSRAASSGSATIGWNPVAGTHYLSVQAVDRAGNQGAWKEFHWGVGGVAVATAAKIPTSTDSFPLSISGPPGAVSAELQWHYAATDDPWTTITSTTITNAKDGTTWNGVPTQGEAGSEVNDLIWSATSEPVPHPTADNPDQKVEGPAMLEVRACFNYSGAAQQCSVQPISLQLVDSAFGGSFPVTDAGPGKVALKTGEFAADATDASVAGGLGSALSISRTYASDSGPHPACVTGQTTTCDASSVFGPGWTASLGGSEAGLAGMQLIDNTGVDGTLVLTSAAGDTLAFAPTSWKVRTGAAIATGDWHGVDDVTPQLGLKATVTGTGTGTQLVVTDGAGVVTTFKATAAPAAATASKPAVPAVFAADTVEEPGAGKTVYRRDSRGRVTSILGALPAGMSAGDCSATSWSAGCRALDIEYATSTTATAGTPGDQDGQVKRITLRVHDDQHPAGATKALASYTYDTNRKLVAATNELTALTTKYAYNSRGRLETLTPPGLTPFTLEYAGAHDRLARVKRDRPNGGGTSTLATIIYDLRPDQLTEGLPDLRPETVLGTWGQAVAPVDGAAVFGPDRPVTAGDRTEVGKDDWPYASLWYTDSRGRTVNTGTFGAGDWQLSYTAYNDLGNPVRQLDAGDIAAIKSGALNVQNAGTVTVYNTATNGPANTPAGTVVTDTYDTARLVRAADGTPATLRPHTRTTYDEGSPNGGSNPATGQGWALPTTVTSDAVEASTLAVVGDPTSVVKSGYGDTAGWTLGKATTSTTVMGGSQADIVTTTGYDTAGRVVEQRQPKSNGNDAGTRRTVYYTKAANADVPACGGKPDWEGLVCRTYYGGAPANGPAIPAETVGGYDQFLLQPGTTTETSGAVTRTTATTYDTAGRQKKSWTALAGATSVPAPGKELEYDAATGLPTRQWATDATGARTSQHVDTGYDAWGRTTSYAPYGDAATTTTYDAAGRVAAVVDPKGTTTYTYDGNDAAGKAERRGLATKVSVTAPSGAVEFSGAYDATGNLTVEKLPGGITRRSTFDSAGQQTGLSYSGAVSSTDGGTTTIDPDASWLAWSLDRDIAGRVVGEMTPDAAAPTGKLAGGAAAAYSRGYTYDRAGRLTKVVDRTATAGTAQYDAGANLTGTACQTREYEFDANGNRTGLTRRGANPDGSCSSAAAWTTQWFYDSADRVTSGIGYDDEDSEAYGDGSSHGYTYDNLGRATSVPRLDTPSGTSADDLELGYYDTDAVRTITQNGTTSTYTLDAAGRRALEATGPMGAATTVTSHFADSSDNPTWAEKTTGGTTTTTRYLDGIGGDLGATVSGNTVALSLANPHGDIVATVALPASGAATGIDAWSSYDEYGNTLVGTVGAAPLKTSSGIGYGWVGAKQRAAQASGLVLMGARLYNPSTGTFTSMDPVYGGNTTTYAYPQDSVNGYDLEGRCWSWCNRAVNYAKKKTVDYVAKSITASVGGYYTARALTGFGVRSLVQARVDARFITRVLYDDFHSWGRNYSPKHRRTLF